MDRRRSFNGKYRIARKSKAETIDVIYEDKEPNIKYGDYELMNARRSVDEVKSSKRLK